MAGLWWLSRCPLGDGLCDEGSSIRYQHPGARFAPPQCVASRPSSTSRRAPAFGCHWRCISHGLHRHPIGADECQRGLGSLRREVGDPRLVGELASWRVLTFGIKNHGSRLILMVLIVLKPLDSERRLLVKERNSRLMSMKCCTPAQHCWRRLTRAYRGTRMLSARSPHRCQAIHWAGTTPNSSRTSSRDQAAIAK